jgi:hypothetical protein
MPQVKGQAGFTRYNCIGLIVAAVLSLEWAYPVLFATSLSVVTSFHTSLLLDQSAFTRMRISEQVDDPKHFHIANFVLHWLPLFVIVYLVVSTGTEVDVSHG